MNKYIAGLIRAKAAQWGLNVAMMANPIGIIIAAVGTLLVLLFAVYKWWNKVFGEKKESNFELNSESLMRGILNPTLGSSVGNKATQQLAGAGNMENINIDATGSSDPSATEDAVRRGMGEFMASQINGVYTGLTEAVA